ncbi:MAG: hypothetical protein WD875_02285 [Pirellulales bacterium]
MREFRRPSFVIVILCLAFPIVARGEEVVENYPDGAVKAKYYVSDGKKNGKYEDFYENGKSKTRALYKDDELTGAFLSFHDNGFAHIVAAYRNGKFHGKYAEKSPEGKLIVSGEFVDGLRHGKYVRYVDGKAGVRRDYRQGDLVAIGGVVTHPRTRAEIALALGKIYATRYVYEPKPSVAETARTAKTPA